MLPFPFLKIYINISNDYIVIFLSPYINISNETTCREKGGGLFYTSRFHLNALFRVCRPRNSLSQSVINTESW